MILVLSNSVGNIMIRIEINVVISVLLNIMSIFIVSIRKEFEIKVVKIRNGIKLRMVKMIMKRGIIELFWINFLICKKVCICLFFFRLEVCLFNLWRLKFIEENEDFICLNVSMVWKY